MKHSSPQSFSLGHRLRLSQQILLTLHSLHANLHPLLQSILITTTIMPIATHSSLVQVPDLASIAMTPALG
jgi:hypothetical protein